MCLITTNAFCLGVDTDSPKTLKSDKIYYNVKSEEIKASGNTELTNAVKNILCMIEYIHGALIYNYKSRNNKSDIRTSDNLYKLYFNAINITSSLFPQSNKFGGCEVN